MRRQRARASAAALGVLLVVTALGAGAEAANRPRSVLILPFAGTDLGAEEAWIGEGVAQSLVLGLVHISALVRIERQRLAQLPQPEAWTEAAVQEAAKALHADLALFGQVRRVGAELTIHPRWVELRGERVDGGALEAIPVPEGALLDRLRELPTLYVRALKVVPAEAAAARMQAAGAPTASLRAFELYVRGWTAAARRTQEGNEAAVDLLARAVEADPKFVVAQYYLGVVHQALGNRWKSAAQFRAATQIDPLFPESYKALGDLFLTNPRRLFEQAMEAYSKAIEIRPFYAEAHVGLGDAKAAKGDVDGAIRAYQKALGHNPLNPRVHVSLGKIYYGEKGLYYESVGAFRRAIELDPRYVEARMGLAEVYEDKGLYQEAVREYRTVIELDPRSTGAHYNLALVYEKVDPREAIALWERYIELAAPIPAEKDWVDVARLHLRKLKSQYERSN
jgi:superkiller protein 3